MVISMTMMCICLLGLGTFFVIQSYDPLLVFKLDWLPLLTVCTYILFFCLGSGQ